MVFWQVLQTMVTSTEQEFTVPKYGTKQSPRKFPRLGAKAFMFRQANGSVLQELPYGQSYIVGLGEDNIFQLGLVGAEGVHSGDALHRSIQFLE